jgi:hypothetical protein
MDGGDVAKTMRMYLMSLNYALKMVKIVHFLFIVFHHNFFFFAILVFEPRALFLKGSLSPA